MNTLFFGKVVEFRAASSQRADRLREQASVVGEPELEWLSTALQELDVTHEELRTVEEELYARSEELSAAYGALQYERQEYRELFDDAPAAYVTTDSAGVVLRANDLACRLLNVDPRFISGKPLSLYVADTEQRVFRDMLSFGFTTTAAMTFQLQFRPRDAAQSVAVVASVRRQSGGTLPGVLRWIFQEAIPVQGAASSIQP